MPGGSHAPVNLKAMPVAA